MLAGIGLLATYVITVCIHTHAVAIKATGVNCSHWYGALVGSNCWGGASLN